MPKAINKANAWIDSFAIMKWLKPWIVAKSNMNWFALQCTKCNSWAARLNSWNLWFQFMPKAIHLNIMSLKDITKGTARLSLCAFLDFVRLPSAERTGGATAVAWGCYFSLRKSNQHCPLKSAELVGLCTWRKGDFWFFPTSERRCRGGLFVCLRKFKQNRCFVLPWFVFRRPQQGRIVSLCLAIHWWRTSEGW